MAQDPYRYFRPEAREILDQFSRGVLDLERGESGAPIVQQLLRLAHTLKGAARVVKQSEIANHAHAIEDALSPLRDCVAKAGREPIDKVLEHLDAINARLLALSAEPAAPAAGKVAAEEPARTIRADLAEADAVLDSVVEAHALMNGLRTIAQSVQQAVQLADLLAAQFSPSSGGERDLKSGALRTDGRFLIIDDLRRKIGTSERGLVSVVDQMDRELRQLRETAERLRLVPVAGLFTTLERMARDTARAQSKQVSFEASGGDVRLDAHVLDTIQGALVQIVRNAVAHGIEPAAERVRSGKAAAGRIVVTVSRRDRRIVFSCTDDGRGVDLDAVRRVASQRGLVAAAARNAGPDELVRVLLRGGISTSEKVTEESGRGIGLDVVRESVERLDGDVVCRSEPGAGTTFELVIPPSLLSMDALIVAAHGNSIATIPLDAVRATLRLSSGDISFAAPGASIMHDDKAIPFLPLATALDGAAWSATRNWAAMIVASDGALAAIGVERLLGTSKITARPLPQLMAASPIVIAAALDSDGNPQVILDPAGLVAAARRGSAAERDAPSAKRPVLVVDDSLTTRMLEQSILESAGYDVDLAVSAEEALERLRDKHYALILVDVEMPGMDGFTFVERIRSDARSRDIPAILVTSLAEAEHRQRGLEVGAQGYIVKSEFDQAELLSMIQPLMAA